MRKSTYSGEYAALRTLLVEIREGAGFSQRQLARKLHVPHTWVAKVESGERRLDLIEFVWFCDACGFSAAVEVAKLIRKWPSRASGTNRRGERRR